ncbi:MAG: RNA polymerase sigma factor RpoD [Chloroflexaceae bacterium]|nr:RNA polymerase sigma factor RpoD [Chloroflexaceae bacterium]
MTQTGNGSQIRSTLANPELERIVAQLVKQGQQREPRYVTLAEVQQAVPGVEENDATLSDIERSLARHEIELLRESVGIDEDDADEAPAADEETLVEELSDALLGDSVRLYLREIGQVPLLTTEQEQKLARDIIRGQEAEERLRGPDATTFPAPERLQLERDVERGYEARQQMAAANLRLVVSIAKRYRDRGLPLLDLIQEGSLGLLRAIEKFDVAKGFKFSTYATWWIKQALSRALADQSRLVRLPVHLGETLNRIQATRRQLTQKLGREPNDGELAQELGMSEEKLRELRRTAQDPVSLATPVGEEADSTLADFIPDPHALDADDAAASGMLRDQIASALDQLTERERKVLELRYGLSDGQPRTLEEVGKAFGVTRERVRQIEVKALRKLRHPRLGKLLKDYLDQM